MDEKWRKIAQIPKIVFFSISTLMGTLKIHIPGVSQKMTQIWRATIPWVFNILMSFLRDVHLWALNFTMTSMVWPSLTFIRSLHINKVESLFWKLPVKLLRKLRPILFYYKNRIFGWIVAKFGHKVCLGVMYWV